MEKISCKKVLKKFKAVLEMSETSQIVKFTACLYLSYSKNYRIFIDTKQYDKNGDLSSSSKVTLYFNDYNTLKETMEYHYSLLSHNIFLKEISEIPINHNH